MVSLLYFGRFSDVASNEETALPEDIQTAQDLINWISTKHEGFTLEWDRAGARVAVNKQIIFTPSDHPISDTDEVAFMSALSGG